VHVDQRKDQALQVLDQVEEYLEALRVLALLDLLAGAQLVDLKLAVVLAHLDTEFLFAPVRGPGPALARDPKDAALLDDPLELFDHQRTQVDLLPNRLFVLVRRLVHVRQPPALIHRELQLLLADPPLLVADFIMQVELLLARLHYIQSGH
jgi:hypothetical protein